MRDSKGKRHFLVTCEESKKVDLKALGKQLGGGNLSFASEERLEKYLGLKQGSVSPFGLMNDEDHAVEFLLIRILANARVLGFTRWKIQQRYFYLTKIWINFCGIWILMLSRSDYNI